MADEKIVCLKLPNPPSCNRSSRSGKNRHYTPREVEAYREKVRMIYLFSKYRGVCFPKGMIKIDMLCVVANSLRDLDNEFKVTFDALTKAGVWHDDNQIFDMHATKALGHGHGYIIITISEYKPPRVEECTI
jgi:crossover junction endodeoxyribonuclease RusA